MSVDPLGQKMNALVRNAQHYERLVLSVQTFNANKSFTDLCFVCARGRKVYAHKLLICTVSSLIKEMILEVQDYLQTIFVHLPDIESHMIELLMDFLYEGSVKVNQCEYQAFQDTMDTLGIVLTSQKANLKTGSNTQMVLQPQQQVQTPQQQVQAHQQQLQAPQQQLQAPQQMYYMPTAPNAQGQMQYVLASPSQLNQAQLLQTPLMSPIVTQQPSGQMVQNGSQVMTSQGNMMQMVQQNNTQVVPMAAGSHLMQCSSQMVMQGNQQSLLSNNQLQVGMQAQVSQGNYSTSQPVQQQPQYVMSSNSNESANNRTVRHYSQPRAPGSVRTRPAPPSMQMQQTARNNSVRGRRLTRRNEQMTQVRPLTGPNRIVQRSRNVVH